MSKVEAELVDVGETSPMLALEPTEVEIKAMQNDPLEWEEVVCAKSDVHLPPFQEDHS